MPGVWQSHADSGVILIWVTCAAIWGHSDVCAQGVVRAQINYAAAGSVLRQYIFVFISSHHLYFLPLPSWYDRYNKVSFQRRANMLGMLVLFYTKAILDEHCFLDWWPFLLLLICCLAQSMGGILIKGGHIGLYQHSCKFISVIYWQASNRKWVRTATVRLPISEILS